MVTRTRPIFITKQINERSAIIYSKDFKRLKDEEGNWKEKKEDIEGVVLNHCSTLITSSFPLGFQEALAGLAEKVTLRLMKR